MVLFYSLEEAAAILGVSTAELRKKTRSGEIRAFLLGGIWRLKISEIHELARRQGLFETQTAEAPSAGRAVQSAASTAPPPTPPASLPVRTPIEHVTPTPTNSEPALFPKIVVSVSASPPETISTTGPRTDEPPAKSAPAREKRKENRIPSVDRTKNLVERTSPTKSEAVPGSPVAKPPQPDPNLKPPRSVEEALPPAPSKAGEPNAEEDILGQVASFLEEIDEVDDSEAGDLSSIRAEKEVPGARKPSDKKLEEAGSGWEKLLDSALASDDRQQKKKPSSDEKAGKSGSTKPLPIPILPSPSQSEGQSSTEKKSERPAFARGFFPIQCPNPECKAYGQVPIGSLYDPLTCATCSAPFYVDRYSNEAISGVRVVGKPSHMRASPAPSKERGPSRFEKSFDKWMSLSTSGKVFALTKPLVVLLACYLVYFFWPRVPNSPDARTREIIAALDRNDPGRVRGLTLQDSKGAVDLWFKKVYSSWPKTPTQSPPAVRLLYSRKNKKRSVASTVIMWPDPKAVEQTQVDDEVAPTKAAATKADPAVPSAKTPQIQLIWVKDSNEWMFDVSETLRIGESTPPR